MCKQHHFAKEVTSKKIRPLSEVQDYLGQFTLSQNNPLKQSKRCTLVPKFIAFWLKFCLSLWTPLFLTL
jgi:hypothetical protein